LKATSEGAFFWSLAVMYRRFQEGPSQRTMVPSEVVLPNLLNARSQHGATPVPAKGSLDVANKENCKTVSQLQFDEQNPFFTLKRSESFYHDSLECQGAFVAQERSSRVFGSYVQQESDPFDSVKRPYPSPPRGAVVNDQDQAGGVVMNDQGRSVSCSESYLSQAWGAVARLSPWIEGTNEVQVEASQAPSGPRSILKKGASCKWSLDHTPSPQRPKTVRFDVPEELQGAPKVPSITRQNSRGARSPRRRRYNLSKSIKQEESTFWESLLAGNVGQSLWK